jgi:2,4-dienoyl-CoA reductase-like NADH-dependent reductase (Old Yellow Enzyme family)
MTQHEKFKYKSLDELKAKALEINAGIKFSDNLEILASPVSFGKFTCPNRMVSHPMEGCDGLTDGTPGELTIRKYLRFAAGGWGLIWVEACAIVPEGRANPHQLWITPQNLHIYKKLVDDMRMKARESMGANFNPIIVLQLTHSGRYSKPEGKPAPIIAHHSIIDASSHITQDTPIVTDEYLDTLPMKFAEAAKLAQAAGFDAVDIKACHRYLISELLASFTRENSRYGGSFENRTRLIKDATQAIKDAVPDIEITSRLNLYDALEYPYGWGVSATEKMGIDFTEPQKLLGELIEMGMSGFNTTIGNPYYNPHFNRPFDAPVKGGYLPDEHPLITTARIINVTRLAQEAFPEQTFIGAGYGWLRQYTPQVAAGIVEAGWAKMVGLGRGCLAYPDFPRDMFNEGVNPKKVCISCSGCTQIMRDGGMSGCIIRDSDIYGPIYKQGLNK